MFINQKKRVIGGPCLMRSDKRISYLFEPAGKGAGKLKGVVVNGALEVLKLYIWLILVPFCAFGFFFGGWRDQD